MFLTERTTSLLVYAFALFLAYILIAKVVRKQHKAVLLLYLIALAIFAFNYKPYITADLYRLREYIEYWIHKDLSGMLKYAMGSSTPSWVLYSYVLSRFGNINWIQTITCLWCFGNVFYIIGREIERLEIQGPFRSMLLFYVMGVGAFYLQTISGIRSMLGISIVAFCLYRETVENKKVVWHLPLWIFAALLHTSTMVLVISRFLFLLIQSQGAAKKFLMGIVVLAGALFSFKYMGSFIRGSFEYGKGYLTDSKEYTYVWEQIIGIIETIETVYVLRAFHRTILCAPDRKMSSKKSLYLFTLIWTAISVIALPFSYAIFRRYTMLCTITSIPLVSELFKNDKADKYRRALFCFSFIIFALSGVRGDLCGYKFFVLG